ncbi:probable E3 ubiquitin-protein ligase RNF217 [Manihot esculenta]|uniref:RBR-type E3 ubiquitin transferase n=1 Tax=Manihot esculenta TaxID=3983 RepID=A0A2C9W3L5_MANES|nr:probable E3 ubiquitin-protein ligase RNF217 [Manihot esculenta]OAY52620.1 hypothetical protein MANES_04G097800v8 [Manihot esculenta]
MAKENVSDLDFTDISALLVPENEEHQGDVFSLYAEELQLQETLMGSVIISQMKMSNPPSALMIEPPPAENLQEAGQSSSLEMCFCEICTETKESNQMFTTDRCAHSYCSDCISKHVAAKIEDSITKVTCPGLNCETVLELETCRVKLSKEVIGVWEEALCKELINASQRFYCPFRDCSAMLVADNEGETINVAECPFCHRLFCARCYVPWHSGVECEVYQKLNEDERGRDDLMVMVIAKEKKWSRCPNCKFFVERTEGCPRIACRCGFQFCYGCESPWTSYETHGQCERK